MAMREIIRPRLPKRDVVFPESDGQPMGETGFHIKCIIALVNALEGRYRGRADVYVGADLLLYYTPTEPGDMVSPDVFVAFGVGAHERRTWKTWEEGKAPDVVFEITSKSTRKDDQYVKPLIYEELGVQEYFLFDPLGEYLKPHRLQGFQLIEGGYQPLTGDRLTSNVLGLELLVKDGFLRFYDPVTKVLLPTTAELESTAAHEAEARRAAEAEAARLREELARLRGGSQ